MFAHYLEPLKREILSAANIGKIRLTDCSLLAKSIFRQTGLKISDLTLQRMFGFLEGKFEPSLYSLTACAQFCGFTTWNEFQNKVDESNIEVAKPKPNIDESLVTVIMNMDNPLVIVSTDAPDFTILTYNKAFERSTFLTKRDVRGKSWWEAFKPEDAGGYGPTQLLQAFHDAVYRNEPVKLEQVHYNIPTKLSVTTEINWWNVRVQPIKYDGVVNYLVIQVDDVTDKILDQNAIEQAIFKELTQAEELAVTNVKLNKVIERLEESHQELFQTKQQLEGWVFERTKKLFESEDRHRKLIDNAPVAIAVLKGKEHIIETANKKILEYWHRDKDVVGRSLGKTFPDLVEQGFIAILDDVHSTGVAYVNPELRVIVNFEGRTFAKYFDMIYQPIRHQEGITDSIFIVAFDITEQVNARKALEESESLLNMAVNAANFGIWSLNINSRAIVSNTIFKQLLGWQHDHEMSYEEALGLINEPYLTKVADAVEQVIADEGLLHVTYQTKRFDSGSVIWMNVIGRVTSNLVGERVLSGIIREVEQPIAN
ncbi:PAS domain S-box protein [Mucilaginibacter achroorhodeus]|uniref:PAS domain S-box protein n=1 Tax=Mucilaginibacter achroorhodeus TaxID=2599294 RepID=A0A563U4G0_9SPHI|nr:MULTISPECIES: PAS domain S-box protein [Mucilaginibacter]QXV64274.1 PAS domain S-box protein [Mucilaginibacter sp. 21P]TWR26237.1 PAS domain S-box protein [Mucilaginibacter achroorhodeus]